MELLGLAVAALLIIISMVVYFFNSKYYYYSILIFYPIIGQFFSLKFDILGGSLNLSMVYGGFVMFFAGIDILRRRGSQRSLNRTIFIFLVYCTVISVFAVTPFYAISWAAKLATCYMLFLAAKCVFGKVEDLEGLGFYACGGAAIVALSYILSRAGIYGGTMKYEEGMKLYAAGYSSGQVIAFFFAMITPLIAINVILGRRVLYASVMIAVSLLVILSTFVRAPILALVLGFCFFIYMIWRSKLRSVSIGAAIAVILILGVTVGVFSYLNGKETGKRWETLISEAQNKDYNNFGSGRSGLLRLFADYYLNKETALQQIFGIGLGSSVQLLGQKRMIHNDFAEILMGCGIIGLALYIMILLKIYRSLSALMRMPVAVNLRLCVGLALANLVAYLFLHVSGVTIEVLATSMWAIHTGAIIGVVSRQIPGSSIQTAEAKS